MTEEICEVCCDIINKSTRSLVLCPYEDCKYKSCKTCFRTFILNSTNDPACIKCNKKFDEEFLINNLNKTFMKKEYQVHRKNILLE